MSGAPIKRQFIAGAVCPECNEQDKVQRLDDGEKVWMECVRCGMTKNLDEQSVQQNTALLDEIARPVLMKPAMKPASLSTDDSQET